jgi:hypothetical protein
MSSLSPLLCWIAMEKPIAFASAAEAADSEQSGNGVPDLNRSLSHSPGAIRSTKTKISKVQRSRASVNLQIAEREESAIARLQCGENGQAGGC